MDRWRSAQQMRVRMRPGRSLAVAVRFSLLLLAGCAAQPSDLMRRTSKNDLSKMATAEVRVAGAHTFHVWLARTIHEQTLGLMNTTESELPEDRGMLFVFPYDRYQSFWMRNTIIPLDIAYIRSDGTIVKTYTMAPLDESGYPSLEPARFALEVRGGRFEALGIREGDRVEIPADVLNSAPPPSEADE